jgi:hypothetical protein
MSEIEKFIDETEQNTEERWAAERVNQFGSDAAVEAFLSGSLSIEAILDWRFEERREED